MQRVIRDKVLAALAPNFTAEQMHMVDCAIADALQGYKVEAEETMPAVQNDAMPEAAEYIARKRSKGLKHGTLVQYTQVLKTFCLATQKQIDQIKDWDVIRFLDQYEACRGIGKRRKDSMRVILNGFFRYMADSGRVRINPMATVEPVKYRKTVRQPLTGIELWRYREACRTPREKALVEFFFATGCRVSEVVQLNKCDIDFYSSKVKVLGKGDKERWVFINAPAAGALEEYFKIREDHKEALFVSDRKPHQRLKKNAIEKIIRTIGERAEIGRRVFPHLIRHTTATHLYQHGMRLEDLQVLLGHESADTTRIYAKDDPAITQRAYMMAA